MSKTCKWCEEELPLERFGKNPKLLDGYKAQCRTCEYERYRIRKLELKYGVTPDELAGMYEKQNSCCAICGVHESKLPKRLHVDHCHETGRVRGLLCNKCNTSIGHFERTPELLIVAHQYLEVRHQ